MKNYKASSHWDNPIKRDFQKIGKTFPKIPSMILVPQKEYSVYEKNSICSLWFAFNKKGTEIHKGQTHKTYLSWKNETMHSKYDGSLYVTHKFAIKCLFDLVDKEKENYDRAILYNNILKKKPVVRWENGQCLNPNNLPQYKHDSLNNVYSNGSLNGN